MKVCELRDVLGRIAAVHGRLGAGQSARALQELAATLEGFDQQTVAALVKHANSNRQPKLKSSKPRKRR